MKTIWFINKEAAPSNEYATHMRTLRQAQFFQNKGYDVKVFCSAVVHNSKIVHQFDGLCKEEIHDGVPIVFVKCPEYGENFRKRVWSFVVFSYNMLRLKGLKKPNIIVHESKTPFDILCIRLRMKYKARYIVDIEDLWPFEFERLGLLKSWNPILRLFYLLERYIYATGEHTVISAEGGKDYVKAHRWDKAQGGPIDLSKIHYVNNGINRNEFEYNANTFKIEDEDLLRMDIFKVVYMGSIRKANNLDKLLDAAKLIQNIGAIRILIFGKGDERAKLEKRAQEEGISNVVFKNEWIDLKFVPYVLSHADLHLLNYGASWAPYGGSMNKMMMAFASGKPMICNAAMPYSEITRYNLGIDSQFATDKEYAESILSIYRMPKNEYNEMCARVRDVSKKYDIEYLCEKFANFCEIDI